MLPLPQLQHGYHWILLLFYETSPSTPVMTCLRARTVCKLNFISPATYTIQSIECLLLKHFVSWLDGWIEGFSRLRFLKIYKGQPSFNKGFAWLSDKTESFWCIWFRFSPIIIYPYSRISITEIFTCCQSSLCPKGNELVPGSNVVRGAQSSGRKDENIDSSSSWVYEFF